MKNLFSFMSREKSFLNANEALNILKYGFRNVTFEEALEKEIEELESSIRSKSVNGFRILSSSYPDFKRDLVEKLAENFKEKGFVVDIYENPDIKGFLVLIIGW